MALEIEEPADDGDSGDTLGVEMALQRARGGGERDPVADGLLKKQTEKLEHELHHLKLRTIGEWFGLVLKGLTALAALMVAVVVVTFAYQAINSRNPVVEQFHVSPDLAEKGLDGTVLASLLSDKLNAMVAATQKEAENSGYSGDQVLETKLEIPETGVSLSEFRRVLQAWLSPAIHISGNLMKLDDQLVLTTRTDTSAKTVSGTLVDLDKLTTAAAESVYAITQPLGYANYLRANRRDDEAVVQLQRLTSSGDVQTRAWAYLELGEVLMFGQHDFAGAQQSFDEAAALRPALWLVWEDLANLHNFYEGDEETGLAYRRKAVKATDFGGADAQSARVLRANDQSYVDEQMGDYAHALGLAGDEASSQTDPSLAYRSANLASYEAAYLHDLGLSQLWHRRGSNHVTAMLAPDVTAHDPRIVEYHLGYWHAAITGDWATAARRMGAANAIPRERTDYWLALEGIALVGAGQLDKARAVIAPLNNHCLHCNVARGLLAAASHDPAGADGYFSLAARQFPSIVRGQDIWGRVKLTRGDYDGAIAIFSRLNRLGPHNADCLEGWGEALLRKGDVSGAARKFTEAAAYAPNWGRLRIGWGIALKALGHKAEAARQFALADGLALSHSERALLASSR